jgi:hypothetical protein
MLREKPGMILVAGAVIARLQLPFALLHASNTHAYAGNVAIIFSAAFAESNRPANQGSLRLRDRL